MLNTIVLEKVHHANSLQICGKLWHEIWEDYKFLNHNKIETSFRSISIRNKKMFLEK